MGDIFRKIGSLIDDYSFEGCIGLLGQRKHMIRSLDSKTKVLKSECFVQDL